MYSYINGNLQGSISVGQGEQGENGKSAYELWIENGNEGTIDDFFASLKGERGENGEDGTVPNITIGKVTTLEPNQQATVVNSGTTENPVFDFGIPKGDKAEAGKKVVARYVHNSNRIIQPTAFDKSTGIFTCESTDGIDGAVVGAILNESAEYNSRCIPYEFFDTMGDSSLSYQISVVVKSETTFVLSYKSNEVTSYPSSNNNYVDVTKFHFEILDTASIQLENFEIKDNYEVRIFGYAYEKTMSIYGFGNIISQSYTVTNDMYLYPSTSGAKPCMLFNFHAIRKGNLLYTNAQKNYVYSYSTNKYTNAFTFVNNYYFKKEPLTYINVRSTKKGTGFFNGFTIEIVDLGADDEN